MKKPQLYGIREKKNRIYVKLHEVGGTCQKKHIFVGFSMISDITHPGNLSKNNTGNK